MTELACHVLSDRVDRLREMVSIGAGHAAGALAALLDCTCWMDVPQVVRLSASDTPESEAGAAAAFFEIEGAVRGTVAIRFPESTAARLGERLLGPEHREALRISALQEVANILASHLIGAVGTLLSTDLRPSVPVLVPRDGRSALEAVSAVRRGTGSLLRVETVVRDTEGVYRIPVTFFLEEP
jgi:chemotaxis protein CheY-P-specific phosphatase CheC